MGQELEGAAAGKERDPPGFQLLEEAWRSAQSWLSHSQGWELEAKGQSLLPPTSVLTTPGAQRGPSHVFHSVVQPLALSRHKLATAAGLTWTPMPHSLAATVQFHGNIMQVTFPV